MASNPRWSYQRLEGQLLPSNMYRRQLVISYAPDWLITFALGAIFFSFDHIDGYQRSFSLKDTSLRHTHAEHERVPNLLLYLVCFGAPMILQPIINYISVRSWWDYHSSALGLVLSLGLTGSITQVAKVVVGRPRPDLLSRCIPAAGATDPGFGLSVASICTQTDAKILRNGFKSFPSGHTSMSFAGLGFLAFYLSGKMHLFDSRGHAGKAWVAVTPFSAAALIAISRTMDYRHHWQDVVAGALLGTVLAYFTYRQYYPDLAAENCHRPHSPRIHAPKQAAEDDMEAGM